MKYPELVKEARELAKNWNEPVVVYQDGKKYDYSLQGIFEQRRVNEPLIWLMTCLPTGGVAQ